MALDRTPSRGNRLTSDQMHVNAKKDVYRVMYLGHVCRAQFQRDARTAQQLPVRTHLTASRVATVQFARLSAPRQ